MPNHYVLGYFLTTNLKRTIGPAAWSQVLNRYYRFPVYPFSFSNSLRRTAGVRVEDLYVRTMSEVDSIWRAQQQGLQLTEATSYPVAADPKIFTQYRYPQYVTDSTVLAVKTGLGDISQLVLLDKQDREKKVFVQGLVNNPEMLSVGADGPAGWSFGTMRAGDNGCIPKSECSIWRRANLPTLRGEAVTPPPRCQVMDSAWWPCAATRLTRTA
ncbi:hypothetical protein [Hymenobacter radiodurans]|uniref:hypothetical protein n=1 Tax=Hymenobacter radiodurans TaxID=2496028 RepID=UPI001F0F825B|nr:hypothetical protein [Hymenobacter radiodurans]